MKLGRKLSLASCLAALIPLASCVMAEKQKNLEPLGEEELKILEIMGGRVLPDGNLAIGSVTVHRASREVSMPGFVNITEGELEVLISTPAGRNHESLLISEIDPYHLQLALFLVGAKNGTRKPPADDDVASEGLAQGSLVDIWIELEGFERFPVEQWLRNRKTNREKDRDGWVFVGSSFTSDRICLATREGNVVNTWSFGNTILDNPCKSGDTDDWFESYSQRMPEFRTPIRIYMGLRK